MNDKLYAFTFMVPETHLQTVKNAIFEAGAGRVGNYDSCSWEVLGRGQFRALPGTNPFIGKPLELETLPEYQVQTVCTEAVLSAVIAALQKAHPYETPAFQFWRINTL